LWSNQQETPILQARNLTKQFPASGGRTLTACHEINLDAYPGKTLGIVGESGCGKSTFVRMLMQLETPTSGEILYHGKDITKQSKREQWENRQHMQMVFRAADELWTAETGGPGGQGRRAFKAGRAAG
jgi:ABC-type oligopeptide transport system ATPase subunit